MWRTHRRPRGPEGLSADLPRLELKRTRVNMGISRHASSQGGVS